MGMCLRYVVAEFFNKRTRYKQFRAFWQSYRRRQCLLVPLLLRCPCANGD